MTPIGIRIDPPTSNVAPSNPQGQVPNPFSFPLSKVNATKLNGGTVKIVDSTTFKISTKIAMAEVTVEPGDLRELHVGVSALKAGKCLSWHSRVVAPDTRRVALCLVTIPFQTSRDGSFALNLSLREGNARMTLFASTSNARTFDYQGGDIGYVPASFGMSSESTVQGCL
jgi:hypothetical protein